jgi:hypothetical protein
LRQTILRDALEYPGRGRVPGFTRETSMKKQVKKLVLSKETVRNLTEEHFTDLVLGGVSTGVASCLINCFYSQQPSCTSCTCNCTTTG